MKVLITGAAGFIGSNLTAALLQEGHEVIGYDNLSQGSLLNLKEFENNSRFRFIQGDVLDADKLAHSSEGCQAIYHLAAFKIPRYADAYNTLHINTQGTQNAVQAALKHDALLIFSSTSDVYGKNPNPPFTEDHDLVLGRPTVRRWSYAISKAFDEQLLFAEGERNKLKFSIVRFFGGYGRHQHLSWWGGPQSVFIDCALENKTIPIHGDGSQTRSFTYVDDHIQGLIKMLYTPQAVGEVFNIGNDREITILNLARLIWGLIRPGTEPKIEFIPYTTFGKYEDVMRRIPDLTKSRRILGFEPKWQMEQGLAKTIEWQIARRKELAQGTANA